MDIIKLIDLRASEITAEEIGFIGDTWENDKFGPLTLELVHYFSHHINQLARSAYGNGGVAQAAFREFATRTLCKGAISYLINQKHWAKSRKRSIGPYLAKCLVCLSSSLKNDVEFYKKASVPVCPCCRSLGQREFLDYNGKFLFCSFCSSEIDRLEKIENRTTREEYEYGLRKVFYLHSRNGFTCPDCGNFIPQSHVKSNSMVSCPYDNCSWFGKSEQLKDRNHPTSLASKEVTLDSSVFTNNSTQNSKSSFKDFLDGNSINADIIIENRQKYNKEFNLVKDVIEMQGAKCASDNKPGTIKKRFMYKAFELLLKSNTEDMINYLIRGKSIGDRPVQSLIFQKYISLIENSLPFTIDDNGVEREIFSLLDPSLQLFLGRSEFTGYVRDSGIISNNTNEIFIGEKCNGPCFIGWLCDIFDDEGKSILSDVDFYTFSTIRMKNNIKQNSIVKVVHFRMPPHYEQFSLVNLQRTRKRIVNSISKRMLNN